MALCANKADFAVNSYCLVQVMNQVKVENEEIAMILKFLTSDVHGYYFGNYMYNKITNEELQKISQTQLNEIATQIIDVNLNNGDCESAFAGWSKVASLVQPERCMHSLLNLLHSTETTELILEVLTNLPQEVLDTDPMVDFQLEFYGTRDEYISQFDSLIPKLTHPLRRSTLTSFLKVFLHRNDEPKTDKVIDNIFNHQTGIQPKELNWIIKKLLCHDKHTEALAMVRKINNVNVTALSYVSIFKYIANKYDSDHESKFQPAFEEICMKMLRSNDRSVHEKFTVEVFNHLAELDIRYAIQSYMKVRKSQKPIRFNHFGMPLQFNQILKFSQKNTAQILQTLSIEAVKHEDSESFQWAISEYRRNGWTIERIVKMLKQHDKHSFLERQFKPEVLNCI
ncbi:uncharacterized protein SPAPADRAFT_61108 [Spathaspora passalidarum NRRL Y-27907]|uniref:Uncharacterized protein n=1 Tax=Spathaspora passalidarum (strain NRRL Y-27907 / 11-Y1) TaxID=619300 RepID=G3ANR3_SPAPN|nr:uncharacterized protein SPAPADRAFT_61108 [Spathaspora passalidarum NRRL Y-27907]EGW31998.1 hypothetical protein SPAPADRAFT_61108 [Spathaspora passalidarum NRRL Y-27907]